MNFIRTVDRDGNLIRRADTPKEKEPVRLTDKQLKVLNDLTTSTEWDRFAASERLIRLKNVVDRERVPAELRQKIIINAVQDTYQSDGAFTARHAINALSVLNGTDRTEAQAVVESWGQQGGEETSE